MHNETTIAFLKGFAMMGSLIIAIGIQNAFLLRQGIKHQAVFIPATICFCCDAFLISVGAAGLGELFMKSAFLKYWITLGGALFLIGYAIRSFKSAITPKGLHAQSTKNRSQYNMILTAFAVSLLNPHAILDTIVLMGGLAARYQHTARYACALGGMSASLIWFYSLAYGAKQLAPILSRPAVWRVIDLVIGCMMLVLAVTLLNKL